MPVRFQVDPDFYDHPKVTGMSDAAFSLWVRAGSYSAAKLTDGFVSEDVLVNTLRSSEDVAGELVHRGLWRRVRGGFRFHQWDRRNLTRQRVEADLKADRERKAAKRNAAREPEGQTRNPLVTPQKVRPDSRGSPGGVRADSKRIPARSVSVSESVSVSGSGRGAGSAARPPPPHPGPEPPTRCPQHLEEPNPPPCGACADARKAHEAWERVKVAWERTAPRCPFHRGQYAHNCALCRSEQLGDQEGG